MNHLPVTGSNQLLDLLDPYIPDECINERWHLRPVRGPRWQFSAAQLWRVHLLALLTPVHSLNLLCTLLSEQRAWRSFARLRHRHAMPDVRLLHAFRDRVGVLGLRQINEVLLQRLIPIASPWENATALMDATGLPAACSGFKKRHRHLFRRSCGPRWAHTQDRSKPLVCRLQETQLPLVVASAPARGPARATDQLGDARQCFRGRIVGAQPALL
jgi:hypothetical protein